MSQWAHLYKMSDESKDRTQLALRLTDWIVCCELKAQAKLLAIVYWIVVKHFDV